MTPPTITIACEGCGVTLVDVGVRRKYCDSCRRNKRREDQRRAPLTRRPLERGETVPSSEPRRYLTHHGYVRLFWKVGVRSYVWTYEHRVIDGHVVDTDIVHHHNQDRSDNSSENLEPMSRSEHGLAHYLTHCQRGHPLEGANAYERPDGRGRGCRACRRLNMQDYRRRHGRK